jgi:DNA polymerase elongation subunit (family B)/predicted RNA-binding Zn-ribbon protein involved in translation (DUF1610 family)
MKTLMLDIETAPHKAYVWRTFKENVSIDQLVEPGYTLCWAARWYDDPQVIFRSLLEWDMPSMLEEVHRLMDEADVIVHYNGKKFDIPTLQREFVLHGFTPPSPYYQVDLYHAVRRQFRFASNKLDFVAQQLGLGKKLAHKGMELWRDCMDALDVPEGEYLTEQQAESWATMKEYNEQDVHLLVELYDRLLPWIPNPPNKALWMDETDEPKCPSCGSTHLRFKGYKRTKVMAYRQYQCNDCGSWSRSRYADTKGRRDVLSS